MNLRRIFFWASALLITGVGIRYQIISANGDTLPQYEIESETVTFASGDITLSGSLILPVSEAPVPGVVMVHGSGRATGDQYRPLADRVAAYGIAVLVYDKRGVGDSEGTFPDVGISSSERNLGVLADDALAGVAYLESRAEVNHEAIGLIGPSQAGWIIPLAASQSEDVAFMVNIVGPTVTVGEEMYYSDLTGEKTGGTTLTNEEIAQKLDEYPGPYGFDPLPVLQTVTIPGLWVLGGKDRSIPTAETVAILEDLVEQGKDFTIQLYPEGDHGLMNQETKQFIDFLPDAIIWIFDEALAEKSGKD